MHNGRPPVGGGWGNVFAGPPRVGRGGHAKMEGRQGVGDAGPDGEEGRRTGQGRVEEGGGVAGGWGSEARQQTVGT